MSLLGHRCATRDVSILRRFNREELKTEILSSRQRSIVAHITRTVLVSWQLL